MWQIIIGIIALTWWTASSLGCQVRAISLPCSLMCVACVARFGACTTIIATLMQARSYNRLHRWPCVTVQSRNNGPRRRRRTTRSLPLKSLPKKKRNKDKDTYADLFLRRIRVEVRSRRSQSETTGRTKDTRKPLRKLKSRGRSEQRIKNLRTRTPTTIKCNTKLRGAKDHFWAAALIIFPLYYY